MRLCYFVVSSKFLRGRFVLSSNSFGDVSETVSQSMWTQRGLSPECVRGLCFVSSSIVRCQSVLRSKSVFRHFAVRSRSLVVGRWDVFFWLIEDL